MVVDPNRQEPSAELLEAFALASEYVEAVDLGVDPATIEQRRRLPSLVVWVVVVAVAVLAVAYYPTVRAPDTPPAPRLEADLRWAVANVAREVEAFRQRHGRLPEAADLHGLLSDAVTYESAQDLYHVIGSYGSVHVEYDGTQPLEEWEAERTHRGAPTR